MVQQKRRGSQHEATPPGSPATAAPPQPLAMETAAAGPVAAEAPTEGVVLASPSASSSASLAASPSGSLALSALGSPPRSSPSASPSVALSIASPASPAVVPRASVGSPAWIISKARKLARDIAHLDPAMVEHLDEVEDLQERGRQIFDLLCQRFSQLGKAMSAGYFSFEYLN